LALEGALAVPVAVPGAGQLEADPGLADHGHEPGTHAVAVRAQPRLKKREAVNPAGVVAGVAVGAVEVEQVDDALDVGWP